MKDGHYYFAFLTPEEQKQFKAAYGINYARSVSWEQMMARKKSDFKGFIILAFFWGDTEQGYEYWENISNRVIDENVPEIPEAL